MTSREPSFRRAKIHAKHAIRLLCHALQFAFKSIAYYIRRASLVNVGCTPTFVCNMQQALTKTAYRVGWSVERHWRRPEEA